MSQRDLASIIDQKGIESKLEPVRRQILLGVSTKKVKVLEDKASFFEGQLNPLYHQNLLLKQQLIAMNKMITLKTDDLRKLLNPIERSGRNRRLEIEAGTMEDICDMIKMDWRLLCEDNEKLSQQLVSANQRIQQLTQQIIEQNKKYTQELRSLVYKLDQLDLKHQKALIAFQQQKRALQESWREKVRLKDKEIESKTLETELARRNVQSLRKELERRQKQHESLVRRLRQDMDALSGQFEETKKNMQLIFQKQLKQKLQELTEQFQMVLKMRQDEMMKLKLELAEKEEEYRKKITEKNDMITKLSNNISDLNQEVHSLKSNIWQLNSQVDRMKIQEAELNRTIQRIQLQKQQLEQKIKEKDGIITAQTQSISQLKTNIEELRSQKAMLIEKHQRQIKETLTTLQNERQRYETRMHEMRQKQKQAIKQMENKMRSMEKQWEEKMRAFEKQKQLLAQKLQRSEQMIKAKEEQLNQAKKQFLQKIQEQKLKAFKAMNAYKEEQEKKIKAMEDNFAKKLQQVNKQNQNKLDQMQKEMNQQKQNYENKLKNAEEERLALEKKQQEQLKALKQKFEQQRKQFQNLIEKERNAMKAKLKQLQDQHNQQLERRQKNHKAMLKKLQDQMEEERAKAQARIKKLIQENYEKQQAMRKEYQRKIQDITSQFESQIKVLKSQNVTDELQKMYKLQIQKIKKDAEQQKLRLVTLYENEAKKQKMEHQNAVFKLKTQHQNTLNRINIENDQKMQKLKAQYERQIIEITRKLEGDITRMNDLLLNQKEEHFMTKMTKQQKIQYLTDRVVQFKQKMSEIENENSRLNIALMAKSKELLELEQQFEQRIQEKVKQFELIQLLKEKEFQQWLQEKQNECQLKIKAKIQENMQFTVEMHKQFTILQKTHEEQLNNMQLKYEELEKIFLQRPSRPEDLSAIKDLLKDKEDMSKIVEAAQLKVKHANEIVKYLQMELQNYKEAYDIFGPNENATQLRERYSNRKMSPSVEKISEGSQNNQPISPIKRSFKIRPIQTELDEPGPRFNTQNIYENDESIEELPQYGGRISTKQGLPPIRRQVTEQPEVDISEQVVHNAQKFLRNLRNQPLQLKSPSSPSRAYKAKKSHSLRKSRMRKASMSNESSALQHMISRNLNS